MSHSIQDLNNFLTDHCTPELEALHATLMQVYEQRIRSAPRTDAYNVSEVALVSATSAALLLSQQAYALVIFGGYIGARVIVDIFQQKNAMADKKHLEPLYCQSELFIHRYPQHAHVNEIVRYLIGMGLSQKNVEQLICALRTFEPNSVRVEKHDHIDNIHKVLPTHLRL